MNKRENDLLKLCEDTNKYTIYVDNDVIFVVDAETDEDIGSFNNYGYEFAYDLLKNLGYNVKFV